MFIVLNVSWTIPKDLQETHRILNLLQVSTANNIEYLSLYHSSTIVLGNVEDTVV